jgi:hypothetical protein
MKTAMQELLEWVRKTLPMDLDYPQMIEDKIESLLPRERQQIEDAWNTAHQAGRFEGKGIAEENWQTFDNYFTENFEQ